MAKPHNGMARPSLTLTMMAMCLLPTVFGCSCFYPPEYSTRLESLCGDYQHSSDVFAGRLISASCNCVPPRNDSSYGQGDIACLSANVSSDYFTTEVVSAAACSAGIYWSCDTILNRFKPIGMCNLVMLG